MLKIDEIIVVEGRDDTAAIRRSVDAATIETHGFGIRPQTWDLIRNAYETKGIIVFTDPDRAGDLIRKRILERFPDAKEAFLDQEHAEKDGDIGIENASDESIRDALTKARVTISSGQEMFTSSDMFRWGLDGSPGAAGRRRIVGEALGIGMASSKTFLQRLNKFGIDRRQLEEALDKLSQSEDSR